MQDHFAMFALYNRWANERLYEAVRAIPDADYRAERGAFFGSLHGTLNHILVADRIWMRRFTGDGPAPTRLDAILFDDLHDLAIARLAEDERIIAFVDLLTEADLAGEIRYRTIARPDEMRQPLAPALAHFFNHQTHHRGQAHGLVTAIAGREAMPSLDLILFQRETGIGMA
ncbi:MAG TPA: DinB family protein [Bauldia sp.]|nr:DinB family protein [Bauldia sp.]